MSLKFKPTGNQRRDTFLQFIAEHDDQELFLEEEPVFVELDHPTSISEAGGEKTYPLIDKDNRLARFTRRERNDRMEEGWRDPVKMERVDPETHTYSQIYVYPARQDEFKALGYTPGWTMVELFNATGKGRAKFKSFTVDPEGQKQISKRLANGWIKAEKVEVSKPITLKDGRADFENRIINKSQLDDYMAKGYQVGWRKPDEFYEKFSVQVGNTKLGSTIGNFSLTPGPLDEGGSCPVGVPCSDDGCYAKLCYRNYANTRFAWDKNLKLMKQDPWRLVTDMDEFFTNGPGKSIKRFRWHVAGDIISTAHRDAILKIATNHTDIDFWLYTKNYRLVEDITPPPNLVIILSAWNDYQIGLLDGSDTTHTGKDGLHVKFPVAYLDDRDHKDLIPVDDEAFICPCANNNDKARDGHCENCMERGGKHPCYCLQPGESVIFRKH